MHTMNTVDPCQGLHIIKNKLQLKYLAVQAEMLAGCFQKAVESTRKQAPSRSRKQGFKLGRAAGRKSPAVMRQADGERYLEACVFDKWFLDPPTAKAAELWDHIVGYQFPLYEKGGKGNKKGWDKLDLLGIRDGLPVVIELKRAKGKESETPFRALVEAIANAVALQKIWKEVHPELLELVGRNPGVHATIPVKLPPAPISVVVLAPSPYWHYWRTRFDDGKLRGLRPAWLKLIKAAKDAGYRVSMGSLVMESDARPPIVRGVEQIPAL